MRTSFLVLTLFVAFIAFTTSRTYAGSPSGSDEIVLAQHDAGQPAIVESGTTETAAEGGHGEDLGTKLPLWSIIPFAGILLSIALFPLFAPHFWHHHFPKVSLAWALLFAVPFLFTYGHAAWHSILHIYLIDYIPFIILLWGLFTVSGGLLVRGKLEGTPMINTIFLLIGTILASWVGTTGASMLMIRPVIRSNKNRQSKVHIIVFFIFLVANIGGSLTPLGDPPLFLGFLHGVSFFWTLHMLPMMSFLSVILLALFFVIDTIVYRRETKGVTKAPTGEKSAIRIVGLYNFIFLGGIVGSVLLSGMLKLGIINIGGIEVEGQNLLRDVLIVGMGVLSMVFTPKDVRKENEFSWAPILEVAYLFAGIFMTIIPALAILRAGEHGALAFLIKAVNEPSHYFWAAGILSSFLDNAPTYLTFFNSALGQLLPGIPEATAVHDLMGTHRVYLEAISCGAVFMGANTYIGNAPNFMVKSIAEESGIRMPSFFGYMLYSVGILIPLFILVTVVFFG